MGLFDTVRCEYPLRNPVHQKLEYQTKDLECALGEYTITREGKLVAQPGGGLFGRKARRAVECPYHGDIRIYTSVNRPRLRGEWVEYLVRFTDGRVQRVRRIGPRLLPKPRPFRLPRPRLEPAGTKSQLPAPSLRGRFLTEEQFSAHAPHRLELIAGSISGDQKLARLLLINIGLARITKLAPPSAWRTALASRERRIWRP